MTWESISDMLNIYSDKIHCFGLRHSSELIASAICINVLNDILYVFYWGEIEGYENLSPIAYLCLKLVEYAQEKNYRILDIGTSSLHSKVNYGLYKFKNNIGCRTCSKIQLINSVN